MCLRQHADSHISGSKHTPRVFSSTEVKCGSIGMGIARDILICEGVGNEKARRFDKFLKVPLSASGTVLVGHLITHQA